MKKKLARLLSLALASLTLSLAITACGGTGSAAGKGAAVDKTFTTMRAAYIDAVGWYNNEIFTLELNNNGTYQLYYNSNRFGAEDYDMRGLRTITYSGKYTSAASADGEPSHLDVSLEVPTEITWEQHGKGFSRAAVMPGTFFVNTSAWTDAMSAVYDPAGSGKKAADFLSEFGKAMTLTVEDSSLDAEDTTLSNRIVTLPDFDYNGEG